MVKKLEQYECEICCQRYFFKQSAVNCESQGRKPLLPVGLCWFDDGDFYHNIAFAIADSKPTNGHGRTDLLWACRSNRNGDSLGKDKCGNGGEANPLPYKPSWEKAENFIRLVKWMRDNGHTPLVMMDDGQVVKLSVDPLKVNQCSRCSRELDPSESRYTDVRYDGVFCGSCNTALLG